MDLYPSLSEYERSDRQETSHINGKCRSRLCTETWGCDTLPERGSYSHRQTCATRLKYLELAQSAGQSVLCCPLRVNCLYLETQQPVFIERLSAAQPCEWDFRIYLGTLGIVAAWRPRELGNGEEMSVGE